MLYDNTSAKVYMSYLWSNHHTILVMVIARKIKTHKKIILEVKLPYDWSFCQSDGSSVGQSLTNYDRQTDSVCMSQFPKRAESYTSMLLSELLLIFF